MLRLLQPGARAPQPQGGGREVWGDMDQACTARRTTAVFSEFYYATFCEKTHKGHRNFVERASLRPQQSWGDAPGSRPSLWGVVWWRAKIKEPGTLRRKEPNRSCSSGRFAYCCRSRRALAHTQDQHNQDIPPQGYPSQPQNPHEPTPRVNEAQTKVVKLPRERGMFCRGTDCVQTKF